MRRVLLSILIVMVTAIPYAAHAQALPETYTAENFTLQYPADWEITLSAGDLVTFSAPFAATGEGQTGGIQIETEGLSITFTVSTTGENQQSAADLALAEAELFAEGSVDYTMTDPQNLALNELPLSVVDVVTGIFDSRYMVMDLGKGNYATVWEAGVMEQFTAATPAVLEVLNTVRLKGDSTPVATAALSIPDSASYVRPDEWIVFDYPAAWQLSEEESHTLLTASGGVTIGISGEPLTAEIPDTPSVPKDRVAEVISLVQADVPTITYGEITEFSIHDQPAARVLMRDDSGIGFGYVVLGLGNGVYANITIIGDIIPMQSLDPTILAIANSIAVPESTEQPQVHADDTSSLQLTQSFTSTEVTFKYPVGWFTYDVEDVIIISNNDPLVQSGDLNNIEVGDIVIFLMKSMAELPDYVAEVLPEDVTPMEVVIALSTETEAAGVALTREKIVLGNHSSAISYGTDNTFDILDIAIQLDNGDIAALLVFFRVGGLDAYKDTVLAVADTINLISE